MKTHSKQSIEQLLLLAHSKYQARETLEAVSLYECVLLWEPGNFHANYRLALMKAQNAHLEHALNYFGRAHLIDQTHPQLLKHYALIAEMLGQYKLLVTLSKELLDCDPMNVVSHLKLAMALKDAGHQHQSLEALMWAFALDPSWYITLHELGLMQFELAMHEDAQASFEKVLLIEPDFLPSLIHQAFLSEKFSKFDHALALYQKILTIEPEQDVALFNLARLYQLRGQIKESFVMYEKALLLSPTQVEIFLNLSALCIERNELGRAEKLLSQAMQLSPEMSDVHFNFGVLRQCERKLEWAIFHYQHALILNPQHANAWTNLGDVLYDMQRPLESIRAFRIAILLNPFAPKFHYHLAQSLLLSGQFEEGWKEFEWRGQLDGASLNLLNQLNGGGGVPIWDGRVELRGKRLLVICEQGLGDVIQFSRFLPNLVIQGAEVILQTPKALVTLFQGQDDVHQVLERSESVADIDFQCSLMSLPFLLGLDEAALRGNGTYIKALPEKAMFWREKMAVFSTPRVGVVWSGGHRPHQPQTWAVNQRRNIALRDFLGVMVQGCTYFSLQKGELAEQELLDLDKQVFDQIDFVDLTSEIHDFSDTAAVIDHLDLIISVDTSTAHLAAAMGKEVWLLNRFDTCWRWLLERGDSPWYGGLKIFRQPQPNDWAKVIQEVNNQLRQWVSERAQRK